MVVWMDIDNIEISVIIITYNHGKTIRKALDSVLSQRISVPIEVLVIDDASTDDTQVLISEYVKKYPEIVHLFARKYNNCYPTKNAYFITKNKARGRYFAFLEGDDYWIDDNKLADQYSFLENNIQYSAVITDVRCEDQNGCVLEGMNLYKRKDNRIFTLEDYKDLSIPGRLNTLFFRNPFMHGMDCRLWYQGDYMMGDMSIYAILLLMGDIFQMDNKTAVYRYVSSNGETNFNSLILDNRFTLLRFIRYWIRIENFIRDNTKGNYRIILIDRMISSISPKYKWHDIYLSLKETRDKKRIIRAALYHFIGVCGRPYEIYDTKNGIGKKNWKEFQRDSKPIVVFGAGALGEEFIANYSWRKKVRFIVDNDMSKVGKAYKGYLVKHPSELLHFKNKVTVLIANEFHEDDIAEQLGKMGITEYYFYYSMQAFRTRNRILLTVMKTFRLPTKL